MGFKGDLIGLTLPSAMACCTANSFRSASFIDANALISINCSSTVALSCRFRYLSAASWVAMSLRCCRMVRPIKPRTCSAKSWYR